MKNNKESRKSGSVVPPVPPGLSMPFYYHSLANCELFYYADRKILEPYVADTGMKLALFDGQGIATFNYQDHASRFTNFDSVVLEVEFNVLAYPASRSRHVPTLPLAEFLHGDDQTKLIGNHHVHVAANNANAVKAGRELFGEPKFLANINSNVPALNSPGVEGWKFVCSDSNPKNPASTTPMIFQTEIDVSSIQPVSEDASPITEYGCVNGKLVGALWNIYGNFQTYLATPAKPLAVKLTYGTSKSKMRTDLQKMIGDSPCAAVRTFQSTPVATQGRSFFVNP